jgi:hypothetical protein
MDKKIKLEKMPGNVDHGQCQDHGKAGGQGVPMDNYLQYTTMVG